MFLALENGGVFTKFGSQVSFVLHQVVQPWHPQGGYVHEVALAVRTAAPEKYVAFVKAVMVAYSSQKKFTDEDTWEKTRSQIYDDLLTISDSVGAPHGKVSAMLSNTGAGTGATQARARAVAPVCGVRVRHACLPTTQALKWATKLHRVRGVHVTPTAFVNGQARDPACEGRAVVARSRPARPSRRRAHVAPLPGRHLGVISAAWRRRRRGWSRAAGRPSSGPSSSSRWARTTSRDRCSREPRSARRARKSCGQVTGKF